MSNFQFAAAAAVLRAYLRRCIMRLRACFVQGQRIPKEETVEAYRRALETMAENQRTVFLLHVREDRSIADIAGQLSSSSAEIEHLLGRAITHICDRLHSSRL